MSIEWLFMSYTINIKHITSSNALVKTFKSHFWLPWRIENMCQNIEYDHSIVPINYHSLSLSFLENSTFILTFGLFFNSMAVLYPSIWTLSTIWIHLIIHHIQREHFPTIIQFHPISYSIKIVHTFSPRPPLKKMFPVQRPGDYNTAEWELFFFFLPFFFFLVKILTFSYQKKKKKKKKKGDRKQTFFKGGPTILILHLACATCEVYA